MTRRRFHQPSPPATPAHASSMNPGSGTGVNVTWIRLPPTSATVGVPPGPGPDRNDPLTLKNGVRSVAPPGVRIGGAVATVDAVKSAIVYVTAAVGSAGGRLVGTSTRLN